MKILVMGTGAIGSYFGGQLKLVGEDVYLTALGEQLRALKANGLRMRGPEGERTVSIASMDDPAEFVQRTITGATTCSDRR